MIWIGSLCKKTGLVGNASQFNQTGMRTREWTHFLLWTISVASTQLKGSHYSDRKTTSGFLFALYRISLEPGFLQGFQTPFPGG